MFIVMPGCKKDQDDPGPVTGTMKDIDGNIYKTIEIGPQTWMAENLKTSKLHDGTTILYVEIREDWDALYISKTPGHWYLHNDSAANEDTYGALYNWYAVNTGILCPTGWHVPSDPEWQTLERTLGMSASDVKMEGYRGTDEGGQMKETGLKHWKTPNKGATNASGFNGLPGGYCNSGGYFSSLQLAGMHGKWWSSSEDANNSFYRQLTYDKAQIARYSSTRNNGMSIRCVMN